MTSIILHIEYLLQHHECVILPGIGAFVAEYISARVDPESGIITPPSKAITLNQSIRHDDGMLATSIARKEQIKFEEARIMLNREVESILAYIAEHKQYNFGKIGRLEKSADGKLEFQSRFTGLARANAAGCPIAFMSSSAVMPEELPASSVSMTSTDASAISSAATESMPEDCYLAILSKKNYYLPINKIFARSAACLIILATLILPFILPQQNYNHEEVKASLNPVESLSAYKTAHLISGTENLSERPQPTAMGESREESVIESDAHETASDRVVEHPEGSYLIVAAFKTRREALKYIDSKSSDEYPLIALHDTKTWKISAAQGETTTLNTIRKSEDFRSRYPKAWIWTSRTAR